MFGVQANDLRRFSDLVSPSFFEVVPMRTLWTQGRALVASMRDSDAWTEQLEEVDALVRRCNIPIRCGPSSQPSSEPAPEALDPAHHGERVLQLYFVQLGHLPRAALDLRPTRFQPAAGPDRGVELRWTPRPLSIAWDPSFLAGIRGLYTGFYRDKPEQFDRSAEALGLGPARDLFRQQFADGDQTEVKFDLDHFKQNFHEIFVRCRDHGVTLHPNFVGLGIYLGGLYEHLDALDTSLNVRAAFDAVWPDTD